MEWRSDCGENMFINRFSSEATNNANPQRYRGTMKLVLAALVLWRKERRKNRNGEELTVLALNNGDNGLCAPENIKCLLEPLDPSPALSRTRAVKLCKRYDFPFEQESFSQLYPPPKQT